MTVYLDTSALIGVMIDSDFRHIVIDTLEHDADWCTSSLSIAEAIAIINRLTDEEVLQNQLEDTVRLLTDHLGIVPIDQTCLEKAAQLTRDQPVKIANAIHIASADRLPLPLTFLTLDPAQIPIALSREWLIVSS